MTSTKELTFNLSGHVSSQGLAVVGTTIRLYDYWQQFRTNRLSKHFLQEQITSQKGTFSFDVRKGIYYLEIIPSQNTRFARQAIELIRVTNNTHCNIILKAGFILEGKVIDNDKNILPNCLINVFEIEPQVLKISQEVDEEGSFSLNLASGKYYLNIENHGNNKAFLYPKFTVLDLVNDQNIEIKIPKLHKLLGKICNKDGHPLAGIRAHLSANKKPLNIFANEIELEVETYTDINGEFECFVETGTYNLRFHAPENSSYAEKIYKSIKIEKDHKQKFTLEPGVLLHGKVLFKEQVIQNALVNITSSDPQININSTYITDETGKYFFSVPIGTYSLTVSAQSNSLAGSIQQDFAPCEHNLNLTCDTEYNINTEEGFFVTGRVLDPNQEPRSGIYLTVYNTKQNDQNHYELNTNISKTRPIWIGISGDDGSYKLRLNPGIYWLVLNNQASTGHFIKITDNQDSNDLNISNICLLNLEVVSENNTPIPNCQISYEIYDLKRKITNNLNTNICSDNNDFEEIPFPTYTNNEGRCILALPSGIYSIYMQAPEHSEYESRQIKQLSVSNDISRRVRLLNRTD